MLGINIIKALVLFHFADHLAYEINSKLTYVKHNSIPWSHKQCTIANFPFISSLKNLGCATKRHATTDHDFTVLGLK